jgi:hypothetical protein
MHFIFAEQGPKLSAPQFSKMLEDATAKEGGKHQFECVVHGYPLPTVQWFKNGVCIDSSPDYICTFNNGQAILLLDEVYLEDEATFSCQAYNRLGNCRCEAKLFVQRNLIASEHFISHFNLWFSQLKFKQKRQFSSHLCPTSWLVQAKN